MKQRVKRMSDDIAGLFGIPEITPGLFRGLQILEALASSKRGLTLSELAFRLHIPKTTTQRLLATLRTSGYLNCEYDTKRYFISEKVIELSRIASHTQCFCARTYMILRELRKKSRLAVHYALLENDDVVIRGRLKSGSVRSDALWVGKHLEVHTSALGKAILAYLPDSRVELIISNHGLPRHNANTISSYEQLREHLNMVRYRGFAFDNEEEELGFRRVASPVFSRDGGVAAAVDIAGTTEQISSENLASLADLVKQGAERISGVSTDAVPLHGSA